MDSSPTTRMPHKLETLASDDLFTRIMRYLDYRKSQMEKYCKSDALRDLLRMGVTTWEQQQEPPR